MACFFRTHSKISRLFQDLSPNSGLSRKTQNSGLIVTFQDPWELGTLNKVVKSIQKHTLTNDCQSESHTVRESCVNDRLLLAAFGVTANSQ